MATDRILREDAVARLTGLSRWTRWRMIKDGEFPASIKVGARAHGWFEHEISTWLKERAAMRPHHGYGDAAE